VSRIRYLAAAVIAYIIAHSIIPILKIAAIKIGFVDKPNPRKIHKEPIPLIGGIGIFIAFFCTYALLVRNFGRGFWGIFIGSILIILIGIIDDWYKTRGKDFPALPKLLIQVMAAYIVFESGIRFQGFTNPLTQHYVLLPVWLQFVLTILWIFGVTTVVNFSDGMDGLAGGLACISGTTLLIVALTKGQVYSAMLAIILIGADLGFLKYNKHPASIFVGDSGATFLGFILAVIALDGAFKQATVLSLFIPVLALGVPIFDNLFVVYKRFMEGKPIYQADTSQVHFRLLRSGMNQKQTVWVLYLVNICFSLTSIIILLLNQ
jgi:UDP-N-acetylmuramyl pentapeptide phosphotransferase/UDP-N-acetylglucosamine-1-phosphate transferase